MINYAEEKGCATEPNFDEFVYENGGKRLTDIIAKPTFLNCDYVFDDSKVLIELKIIETEFAKASAFHEKVINAYVENSKIYGFSSMFRPTKESFEDLNFRFIRLFRPPISRILKKANKQLRESKNALGNNYSGIVFLVNDSFRELSVNSILYLLGNLLKDSYSEIEAIVYLTNHHVAVPWSEYALLVWAPLYQDSENKKLFHFINDIGGKWSKYSEKKLGKFDVRYKGDDIDLSEMRTIK